MVDIPNSVNSIGVVCGLLWLSGVHSLLYFVYTCIRDLFIGGLFYLIRYVIFQNKGVIVFYM